MDSRTLAFVAALVAAASALLTLMLAAYRRNPGLGIFAAGFTCGMLGFLLFLGQGSLSPWLGVFLANLLTILFHFILPWGLRAYCMQAPAWPPRFWLYLGLWVAVMVPATPAPGAYLLRAVAFSLCVILLLLEFLRALRKSAGRVPAPIARAARLIALGHLACHAVRILLLLGLPGPSAFMGADNAVSAYTFCFGIFFTIMWAGLVMVIDVAGLLEEVERKNGILEGLVSTDGLTGLSNRRLLEEKLPAEMERAARYAEPLSMVLFDLDHFKRVNDTWGHQAGDAVLERTASVIREMIREPDTLFRWGGEEFIILVPHTGLAGAVALAGKVRAAIAETPFPAAGRITASFGVAEWRRPGSREEWFRQVDQALYRAKNEGRDRVVAFGEGDSLPVAQVRLEWRAEWESGDALIDGQHRRLLELANELLDRSLSGLPGPELLRLLDGLLEHVSLHFADEERLLAALAWPGLEEHARLHGELVSEALGLREVAARTGGDPGALFHFLVERVLMGHLLQADVLWFPLARRTPA